MPLSSPNTILKWLVVSSMLLLKRRQLLSTSTHTASIHLCVQRDGRVDVRQRHAVHRRALILMFYCAVAFFITTTTLSTSSVSTPAQSNPYCHRRVSISTSTYGAGKILLLLSLSLRRQFHGAYRQCSRPANASEAAPTTASLPFRPR